jgi:hypothetical protein
VAAVAAGVRVDTRAGRGAGPPSEHRSKFFWVDKVGYGHQGRAPGPAEGFVADANEFD